MMDGNIRDDCRKRWSRERGTAVINSLNNITCFLGASSATSPLMACRPFPFESLQISSAVACFLL